MDIDLILSDIGELGRQQLIYCSCFCLLNVYAAFHMLQYAFVSFHVDFSCVTESGKNLTNACEETRSSCKALFFDTRQSSSIESEWSLVCDQNYLSKATMSVFMAGVMTGAFFLGKLADSIGRKKSLTLTVVGIIVFNTISSYARGYTLYICAKFGVGFFCAGNILAIFVLGNELVGPSKRSIFGVTLQASFSVGIVLMSLVAYYVQHWRQLTLLISFIGTPFIFLHWILPESPRWLLSQSRQGEALKVLEEIARGNGSKLSNKVRLQAENMVEENEKKDDGLNKSEGLLDLFRSSPLCLATLTQLYSWFVNSASYYGLTLAAGGTGGDLYTATALSGAVEIPAYVLANFLLGSMGRRFTLGAFMIVGGLACLAIQVLSLFDGVSNGFIPAFISTCALLGKLSLAASFAVVYIHSGEIFPTTIRNSAMGIMSVAARIGGILAPFIVLLGSVSSNLQFTVFGLLSLTAGLLNLRLPETLGAPLPDTMLHMEGLLSSKGQGSISAAKRRREDTVHYKALGSLDASDEE